MDIGEAYSLLGEGFSKASMSREDEMRRLMKQQQRQQLVTAALTPVAQGLGKSITGLISEPFKQAASDFYSSRGGPGGLPGRGAGIKANINAVEMMKSDWSTTNKAAKQSGGDGLSYFRDRYIQDAERLVPSWGAATFGKDYESNDHYLSAWNDIIQGAEMAAQEDLKQHKSLGAALSTAATTEQINEVLSRRSPVGGSLGKVGGRFISRILKRQSADEYTDDQINLIQKELGITPAEMDTLRTLNSRGQEFGFTREVISSLPSLQTSDAQRAISEHNAKKALKVAVSQLGGANLSLYNDAVKEAGRLITPAEFSTVRQDYVGSLFGNVKTADREDFIAHMNTRETTPEAVRSIIAESSDLEDSQQLVNDVYKAVYNRARQTVEARLVKNPEVLQGNSTDGSLLAAMISKEAESFIDDGRLKVVAEKEPNSLFGTMAERLVISDEGASPASETIDESTVRAETLYIAPGSPENDAVIVAMTNLVNESLQLPSSQGRENYEQGYAQISKEILKSNPKYRGIQFSPELSLQEGIDKLYAPPSIQQQRTENLRAVEDFLSTTFRSSEDIQRAKKKNLESFRASAGITETQKEPTRSLMERPQVFDDASTVDTVQTSGTTRPIEDVESTLQEVSRGFNDSKAATSLLKEIAIAESNMGQTDGTYNISVDSEGNKGSLGLAQIDEIAFNEVQRRLKGGKGQNKYTQSSIDKAEKLLGVDPSQVSYEDLADDKTNLVFARLYLMSIPDPIPPKVEDRAKYWKTHYNTVAGKGTPEKYLERLRQFGLDV